jgi:hypothetical protein
MVIVLQIANGIPDTENVRESTTQRSVTVQQFNVQTARTHMKHGVMSADRLEESRDRCSDLFIV